MSAVRRLFSQFGTCSFCGHIHLFHTMKRTSRDEAWRTCALCGDMCTEAVRRYLERHGVAS